MAHNYSAYSTQVTATATTAPPLVLPSSPFGSSSAAAAAASVPAVKGVPHLAWPPRLVAFKGGGVVYEAVEQDTPDHIEDRIQMSVRTVIGDRLEDPEFGIPDDVLRAPEVDLDAFKRGLVDSEPEAELIIDRITDSNDLRTDVLRTMIVEEQ